MMKLCRLVRRLLIRWQLRDLEEQTASILEARQHALARLMEIERESVLKKQELWQSTARDMPLRAGR
jgi:hypothetical protein